MKKISILIVKILNHLDIVRLKDPLLQFVYIFLRVHCISLVLLIVGLYLRKNIFQPFGAIKLYKKKNKNYSQK